MEGVGITAIVSAVGSVLELVGTVVVAITGNPVLALGLGFTVIGGAIGVFRQIF